MNSKTIDKFFELFHADQIDDALALYHTDCIDTDHATGEVNKDKEAIRNSFQFWKSAFSDMNVTIRKHVEEGNTVATELTFKGTNNGDLPLPDGSTIPATNKVATLHGCQITVFDDDGLMIKTDNYYNIGSMMEQLGIGG